MASLLDRLADWIRTRSTWFRVKAAYIIFVILWGPIMMLIWPSGFDGVAWSGCFFIATLGLFFGVGVLFASYAANLGAVLGFWAGIYAQTYLSPNVFPPDPGGLGRIGWTLLSIVFGHGLLQAAWCFVLNLLRADHRRRNPTGASHLP